VDQQDDTKKILNDYNVIAVVGLSKEPEKPSFQVAFYLKSHGYKIIPVNPTVDKVLGEKSYKSLLDMPIAVQKTIEVVDIFRRSEDVPPIVEQAIKLKQAHGKLAVIWMQSGIVNEEAAKVAEKAGLLVVMDKCIMRRHRSLNKVESSYSY
jgi:predicted CoA-binding protein